MNAAIIQRVLELRVYMATQRSCLGEWKVVRYEHNQSPFGRLGLRDGSGDRWFPVAFDVSDEAKDFLTLLVKGGVQHDLDGEHAEGTCLLIYSHETDVAAAIIRTPCRFFVGAPDAPEPSIENG